MDQRTVVKIKNIPHGFYENEMEKYFNQFGKVRRVALVRSEKTKKSRGFAFVEFAKPEPARAAKESMNNYLMFNHILKCKLLDVKSVEKVLKKYCSKRKQNKKLETSVDKYKKHHNTNLRDKKYIVKHYKKILRTQKLLQNMGIKLNCKILNPPDLFKDTDSITSGSTNSGETFSATASDADSSSIC